MKTYNFCNYRFDRLNATNLAAAYNQHRAKSGNPEIIRVNPQAVTLVMDWLKIAGLNADVQANGGTLAGEVWIA